MHFQIIKNLEHFASGVIHWEKLPQAWQLLEVGSRAFVRAVMAYQAAWNLVVDGVCGPVTMAKILEEECKPAKPKKKAKKQPKEGSASLPEEASAASVDGGAET
jgi:hypothetical protein